MRFSKLATKTTKHVSKDATSANAKLLTQGGFIGQVMTGVYTYLPLGLRVLEKIKNIVREEMNDIDSQEMLMSALMPTENYVKTGRDQVDIAYKPTENTTLGFSHEEGVVPVLQNFLTSYKDLPISVYQVQNKFRYEKRAKAGILRGREFTMKDMYSFHADQDCLDSYYERAAQAYMKVYNRLSLEAYAIEASGGIFAKENSHEFVVETEVGEDIMLFCAESGIAQNKEIAKAHLPHMNPDEAQLPMQHMEIERKTSVRANAEAHNVPDWKILKTVVYLDKEGNTIAVCIRGDLAVNDEKIMKYLGFEVKPCDLETLTAKGLVRGFISPVGYTFDRLIADISVNTVNNFVTGANKLNQDIVNVNVGTDIVFEEEADLYVATEGMMCYSEQGLLQARKVSEVGNIFKLSDKYGKNFGHTIANAEGKNIHPIMGCYGIGISRIMGIIVEKHHDERGIIWPKSVAPYQVHLVTLGKDEDVIKEADNIYKQLKKHRVEVIYDDRKISPGKKLGDSDLLGMPLRIVISNRTLAESSVEWKLRDTEESEEILLNETVLHILDWVRNG